ncbi:MAG: helix-turn-helix domain-containing protein [Bacillota bacterium]
MAGVGEQLRQARLKQGIDLKEAESATKIRLRYLEALENEEFNVLPGRVYVIGFLRTYAKFLNIDSDKLIEALKSAYPDKGAAAEPSPRPMISVPKPRKNFARRLIWFLLLVVLASVAIIAFNYVLGFFRQTPEETFKPLPVDTSSKTTETPSAPVDSPPTPTQLPDKPRIELIVIIERDKCWISAESDGKQDFRGTMVAGQQLVVVADQVIRINFGNAGAARVFKNGEDQGILGKPGQVVSKEYRVED